MLSPRYAYDLAPWTGFFPMLGAMMLATIYIPLRRLAGAWIGILMPLMLSSYELELHPTQDSSHHQDCFGELFSSIVNL